MADDNRPLKYMRYAIGEIILVVIGILIALQINNWNDMKKKSKKESTYIKSLSKDLQSQVQVINNQIKEEERYIYSGEYVLDVLNQTKEMNYVFDHNFFDHFTNLTSRKTFRTVDATYTDLISTGELNLISNSHIKNEIVIYFQELERIESIIQNNNTNIIDGTFLPEVQKQIFYYRSGNNLDIINEDSDLLYTYIGGFNSEEAAFASGLILQPKNKLSLKNILKQRLLVATFHSSLMKEMLKKTEILASKLALEE